MVRLGILAFLVAAASASVELAAHPTPVARVPSGGTSAPVLGESVLVAPVRGRVLVRSPGAAELEELSEPRLLPVGSEIDASEGEVELTSAADAAGTMRSGRFSEGRFRVLQERSPGAATELELSGGDFATCFAGESPRVLPGQPYRLDPGGASIRHLWGNARGKFRTRGRYSSTTVRGTVWLTDDRCGGTLTEVDEGSATVLDFARDEEIELEAGESHLAELFGWGNIISIAIDPTAPGTVYLAAWDGKRGAFLFKTTNAGVSWSALGERVPHFGILVVDPGAPGTVYAVANAGGSQGVFKSADGGRTWRPMRRGMRSWSYIRALVVVPRAHETLYAGYHDGVYKTVDGGRHWFPVDGGLGDKGVSVTELALDPRTGDTVYAATSRGLFKGDDVFKTTDGGQSWTRVLVTKRRVGDLAVDPQRPDIVYVNAGDDLLKSVDGGGSWSTIASGVHLGRLAFDPRASETMYASARYWEDEHSSGGVLKTTDGGVTWNLVGLGDLSVDVVTVDPNSHTVYAGTDQGLYKSGDGGVSWQAANAGLAITPVTALAVAPSEPRTVYAGTLVGPASVIRSRDGGRSWAPAGAVTGPPNALAVDPRSPLVVYAGGRFGVFKTTDGGLSWNRMAGLWADSLVIDPRAPDTVYAGLLGGVFKTTDGGTRWKPASRGLGRQPDVDALVIDPRSPRTLYVVVRGNAFKSTDGGEHWAEVGDDPSGPVLEALAIDPRSHGTLYAGGPVGSCCGHERAVFRSTNAGRRWKAWCTVPKGSWGISALVVDPSSRGTVYAGTSDGVFESTKPGGRCRQLAKGYAVSNLAIDPRGTTLYATLPEGANLGVLILPLR